VRVRINQYGFWYKRPTNFCFCKRDNAMRILFSAPENAWGGIFYTLRSALPEHRVEATGCFAIESVKGIDVLIPTTCPVTGDLLRHADRLRLVQQCGAGLEGVDIEAARKRNIWVANVPTAISGSADSVAEMGIYLMIGLSRDSRGMARSLEEKRTGEPFGRALGGATVGLVGLGGIGRALAKRLPAFDVRLIGIRRHHQREAASQLGLEWIGGPEDFNQLLAESDYVILCLPLTAATSGLMDRKSFLAMKPGAFLINLARAGLVVRDALEEALASSRIAGAGMDVFWEEPPDPDDPLFRQNVLVTPHVAALTDVAMRGVVRVVVENIRRLEKNQQPLYCAGTEVVYGRQ
jgi:phosphoglycerate dehydrogenase-like enzyme